MLRGRCASTRRAADTRAEVVLSVDREANGSAVTFTGKSHVLSGKRGDSRLLLESTSFPTYSLFLKQLLLPSVFNVY